ncbi:MAG: amino acid racemase, partial [Lachnospiraceae bacterium]|nr:amino acid racemase [Lachnospiraceae bacterium]
IRAACEELQARGVKNAGILATDGTIRTGLYQRILKEYGIEASLPDSDGQRRVMDIIYREAKAGKPISAEALFQVSDRLLKEGAEACILGCTELSLANKEGLIPREREGQFLDVMESLAKACILACGGKIKQIG